MNLEKVEQIAKAVLYEGYMLYPYRPTSVKNRQRFNFGVLYPESYSVIQEGTDACSLRTECLIHGDESTRCEASIRFLHLRTRSSSGSTQESIPRWREAVERDVSLPTYTLTGLCRGTLRHMFAFPDKSEMDPSQEERQQQAVAGIVEISARKVSDALFKISLSLQNNTHLEDPVASRDAALMRSLVSAHVILGVRDGDFISLLEPPESLREAAQSCQNVGVWPVLVGDPGQCDTVLASPIILYDYPQIAPESTGDLFDGTEIDEILSLRIMTLTDEEKEEVRRSDERARQILERTESMPAEQFMKLHGALRQLRPAQEDTP